MKNTNSCPKCNGKDILKVPGDVRPYGAGNNITIGLLYRSAVKVNRYVCCTCGYCEEWVNEADIARLKKKYS